MVSVSTFQHCSLHVTSYHKSQDMASYHELSAGIDTHKLQLRRIGPQKLRPNVAPKSWPLHVAVLCR